MELIVSIMLICKAFLQDCKDNNIEALKYMGCMCGIAHDNDLFAVSKGKEIKTVMGVVTIQNKEPIFPICPFFCGFMKILQPLRGNLIVGPTFV